MFKRKKNKGSSEENLDGVRDDATWSASGESPEEGPSWSASSEASGAETPEKGPKHAVIEKVEDVEPDASIIPATDAETPTAEPPKPEFDPNEMFTNWEDFGAPHEKAHRSRRRLLTVIVALLVIIVIAVVAALLFAKSSNTSANEAGIEHAESDQTLVVTDIQDASPAQEKMVEIPNLVVLVGKTQAEALTSLGHGATATATKKIDDEDKPVSAIVTVTLADDHENPVTGKPAVTLELNKSDKVAKVTYVVEIDELGVGAASFVDAINNLEVIQMAANEAGIPLEDALTLPEDKKLYSKYAADGTTLLKEVYQFKGETVLKEDGTNDVKRAWTATLSYDYAKANESGNLDDVVRTLTLTIS